MEFERKVKVVEGRHRRMLNTSRENEGLCHERYDTDIFKENVNNMKMPEQYCRQILLFPLFHETFLILSVKYRRTI